MNEAKIIKPLNLIVSELCLQARADVSTIDGAVMAACIQRLIAQETAPGGPYKDESGVVDVALNRSIAELFLLLGIPLPNIKHYLADYTEDTSRLKSTPRSNRPLMTAPQKRAFAIIATYAEPLGKEAKIRYSKILKVDRSGEVSRLSEWFATSIGCPSCVDDSSLGAANILTWIAYSLYDAFIDGEGDPRALPVANATHRDALRMYREMAQPALAALVDDTFRTMDEANAWELAHCRWMSGKGLITVGSLPDYGDATVLARRAAAHILGPLIIMHRVGLSQARFKALRVGLYDYLIARQLNDDLHDWVEDFTHGHISPVVAYLVRAANIPAGTHRISACLKQMKHVFWKTGLNDMSDVALSAVDRARTGLIDNGMAHDSPFMSEIVLPIQSSLMEGKKRQDRDRLFYETYAKG